MPLRDYQILAVSDARRWIAQAKPGDKKCYAAPTGSGKSIIELTLLEQLPRWLLITPRIEIIRGMLEKLNLPVPKSDESVVDVAWEQRITTPIRLRNKLARGEMTWQPEGLLIDEGHHAEADTYQEVDIMLDRVPAICFTATPYCGSAKATIAFKNKWGKPTWAITYSQAAQREYISIPRCTVQPLVNDDIIEVQNGEFQISRLTEETCSAAEGIVELCKQFFNGSNVDRPTIVSLPSKECCYTIAAIFKSHGLPAEVITEETKGRQEILRRCLAGECFLLQINVISEGVDAPFRRLVDCRATMSPRLFVQQLGRIMRPTDIPPEYICTNRNLERFCYLLDGILPSDTIIQAQTAFDGGVSSRFASRVLGLETLGRFKPAELPLKDGTTGIMYNLQAIEGAKVVEYAVLISPTKPDPIIARKIIPINPDGTRSYKTKWEECELPEDLIGYASAGNTSLTQPMKNWWDKSAESRGLDPFATVTRKNFQALPVLSDLRKRL